MLEYGHSTESMIASLDAEKAFDSIEHWYIRKVLKKIGLSSFIRTFDLLYKSQSVDIILNGNKAGKYQIKNGVKQGDALSCILFILGVEPLLDNINADNSISNVNVRGEPLPKIVAYADDIACLIKPDTYTLQKIFEHYDNLTSVSGLKLNADKTEIISMGGNASHEVSYNNLRVKIDILEQIKVNGLLLSYNNELARKENIRKMLEAVRVQLANWTKMNLSIIGKIQIYKTFGLSQILYTLATVQITPSEEKSLTNLIYKFIWNKDMSTNKAPDRIKRNILLGKIKSLGFGMIDYKEVVKSIRIRNVIRLLNLKNTPLAKIIRTNINTSLINV